MINENSLDGQILEVDLEYPDEVGLELHELLNDYPLPPDKLEVNNDMLSKYCCNIAKKYDTEISCVNKFVPNLGNKSENAVHYKNVQLYLSLGIKLVSLHRILKFKKSDFLKNTLILIQTKEKNAVYSFVKFFFF